MNNSLKLKGFLFFTVLILTMPSSYIFADGTETLGPPDNISLATGSGIVTAGVGMLDQSVGTIDIDVPGDVRQALLYWVCESYSETGGDDTILVDTVEFVGNRIGGTTELGTSGLWTVSYRADISSMVNPGFNQLVIEGLDCTRSTGVGLIAIYNDDSDDSEIQIRDGSDFAFCRYDGNLHVTVPQTFQFSDDEIDRTAKLYLLVSSIEAPDLPDTFRRNSLEITINGVTDVISNALLDSDGHEWDTFVYPVEIPAGTNALTVQIFSRDDSVAEPENYCPHPDDPNRPASLVWVGAGLSMQNVPFHGCTPGYWKQEQHYNSWVDFEPGDFFNDVFDTSITINWSDKGKPQPTSEPTLLQSLEANGGEVNALARHAVAALLNAANPDINYPRNVAQVIDMVFSALDDGDVVGVKNMLVSWNEKGCSVNGHEPILETALTSDSPKSTKLDGHSSIKQKK